MILMDRVFFAGGWVYRHGCTKLSGNACARIPSHLHFPILPNANEVLTLAFFDFFTDDPWSLNRVESGY